MIKHMIIFNELLYTYLSGFTVNHSTNTTLLSRLTDMILNGAENRKHTSTILIVLQTAFDTLDHKILLDKMECISFPDEALKWFYSYLTSRTFFVSSDNVFSEAGP